MSALRRERRREILLSCQAKDPKEYFVYFKGLRRGQGSKGTVSAEVEVPNGFLTKYPWRRRSPHRLPASRSVPALHRR